MIETCDVDRLQLLLGRTTIETREYRIVKVTCSAGCRPRRELSVDGRDDGGRCSEMLARSVNGLDTTKDRAHDHMQMLARLVNDRDYGQPLATDVLARSTNDRDGVAQMLA